MNASHRPYASAAFATILLGLAACSNPDADSSSPLTRIGQSDDSDDDAGASEDAATNGGSQQQRSTGTRSSSTDDDTDDDSDDESTAGDDAADGVDGSIVGGGEERSGLIPGRYRASSFRAKIVPPGGQPQDSTANDKDFDLAADGRIATASFGSLAEYLQSIQLAEAAGGATALLELSVGQISLKLTGKLGTTIDLRYDGQPSSCTPMGGFGSAIACSALKEFEMQARKQN